MSPQTIEPFKDERSNAWVALIDALDPNRPARERADRVGRILARVQHALPQLYIEVSAAPYENEYVFRALAKHGANDFNWNIAIPMRDIESDERHVSLIADRLRYDFQRRWDEQSEHTKTMGYFIGGPADGKTMLVSKGAKTWSVDQKPSYIAPPVMPVIKRKVRSGGGSLLAGAMRTHGRALKPTVIATKHHPIPSSLLHVEHTVTYRAERLCRANRSGVPHTMIQAFLAPDMTVGEAMSHAASRGWL